MQTRFAGLHLFAGKLSLFALHFVGAGLCSARSSDQIGTSGQIRAPLLQNAPQRLPFQGMAFGSAHPKPSPMKGRRRGGAATDAVGQSVFAPAMRFARFDISIFIYAIRVLISIQPY